MASRPRSPSKIPDPGGHHSRSRARTSTAPPPEAGGGGGGASYPSSKNSPLNSSSSASSRSRVGSNRSSSRPLPLFFLKNPNGISPPLTVEDSRSRRIP